jgi:hypothetical protein
MFLETSRGKVGGFILSLGVRGCQRLSEADRGCYKLTEAVRDHQYAVVDFSEHEAPNFLVASA